MSVSSKNCLCAGKDKFHFLGFDVAGSGTGLDIVVVGEEPIVVTESITSTKKQYTVKYEPHDALQANLSFGSIVTVPSGASYKNGVIPLKGVVVDEVLLNWSFIQGGNPVDVYQEINTVQVSPNTVKSLNKVSQALEYDDVLAARTFTLFGDDEQNKPGSTSSDNEVLTFGNRIWMGEGNIEEDDNLLRTLLTGLGEEIRLDENISFLPQSLASDVYVYIAIPSEFDVGTIFVDLNSPVAVDPMKVHRTGFTLSNGFINDTYEVYISKQGALRNAIIQPE